MDDVIAEARSHDQLGAAIHELRRLFRARWHFVVRMETPNLVDGLIAVGLGVAAATLHLGRRGRADEVEGLTATECDAVDAGEDVVAAKKI
jgi:hypothetical protein